MRMAERDASAQCNRTIQYHDATNVQSQEIRFYNPHGTIRTIQSARCNSTLRSNKAQAKSTGQSHRSTIVYKVVAKGYHPWPLRKAVEGHHTWPPLKAIAQDTPFKAPVDVLQAFQEALQSRHSSWSTPVKAPHLRHSSRSTPAEAFQSRHSSRGIIVRRSIWGTSVEALQMTPFSQSTTVKVFRSRHSSQGTQAEAF